MDKSAMLLYRIGVLALMVVVSFFAPPSTTAQSETFQNPLNQYGGADPWLVYHDGFYYLATTTWTSELTMRKSPTLSGLKTVDPVQIYHETDASRCCNMWAPEFHLLDGPDGPRWYFYYTAGTRGTHANQHTHVLESAGTDPLGPYTYKGRLFDADNDTWAIDGSILTLDDKHYFLFSAWVGNNQSLFISPMADPWTLSGSRTLISTPTYDWERQGLNVNEAPVALQHVGDTFIIYSASFCATPDYKLGMLTYVGGDPLSTEAWSKHPEPLFQHSDTNGVFGPGHNGFFLSPDGSENWIVYHANDSINGGCDGGRTTRVQKFTWNADGTPNFGEPVSSQIAISNPSGDDGVDPLPDMQPQVELSRIQSYQISDGYIRHVNFQARVDIAIEPFSDSEFIVMPGLADPDAISLMSVNFPGWYLRHREGLIVLDFDDGGETFEADATWWLRPGFANETWISFESYNLDDRYLLRFGSVMAAGMVETDSQRENATFRIVESAS